MSEYYATIPAIREVLAAADHHDARSVVDETGDIDLRTYLANMFGYAPQWLKTLYNLRRPLAVFLGLKHATMMEQGLTPDAVPFEEGGEVAVFRVVSAQEDRYWLGMYEDVHLRAHLAVAREPLEPLESVRARYHVVSIVDYRNRTGPVYFAAVRPVHEFVFRKMARAGLG
jgi:hypothetical protein